VDEYQAPLGDVFDVPQPTVGEMLRRARTEKGIDLNDMARETRVPIRHLTAIENDAHDSLPALPYAVGFVKTFARHVGLSPNALAAQFRKETSKGEHVPVVLAPLEPLDDSRRPSTRLIVLAILAIVAVVALVWAYSAGLITRPLSQTPVATVEPAPAPEPVAAVEIPPPPPVDTPADPTTIDPAAIAAQTGETVVAPADGQVIISATEDAWFKVYDANGTVKMGILQAGESYAVPAEPADLKLWTGNAGALRLTVGGKPVAAIGAAKQTIKDVSLTPTDLLSRVAVQP
jgi:cytoskeleton protein RodZ